MSSATEQSGSRSSMGHLCQCSTFLLPREAGFISTSTGQGMSPQMLSGYWEPHCGARRGFPPAVSCWARCSAGLRMLPSTTCLISGHLLPSPSCSACPAHLPKVSASPSESQHMCFAPLLLAARSPHRGSPSQMEYFFTSCWVGPCAEK